MKCNIDAAVDNSRGCSGLDWVVRDTHGSFVGGVAAPYGGVLDLAVAEACSFLEALSWL